MSSDYPTVIRATRPWNAVGLSEYERDKKRRGDPTAPERDGRRARRRDGDSPEQIQMCLNCKLASCRNCVGVSPTMHKTLEREYKAANPTPPKKIETRGSKPRGEKSIKQQIRELMHQGYDEKKIAWKLNADRTGVRNVMQKIMKEEERD